MCFFDQTVWSCGNWRWSRFRQQCNKEYRIGETCGLKLVFERHELPKGCRICDKIGVRERKIASNTRRMEKLEEWGMWASYLKCEEDVATCRVELGRLYEDHKARVGGIEAAVQIRAVVHAPEVSRPDAPEALLPDASSPGRSRRFKSMQMVSTQKRDKPQPPGKRPIGVQKRTKLPMVRPREETVLQAGLKSMESYCGVMSFE
ncbi:hypothetical protein ACJZ2D_001122 [Fusarium nematophilum]